jgi:hypothetical protein
LIFGLHLVGGPVTYNVRPQILAASQRFATVARRR